MLRDGVVSRRFGEPEDIYVGQPGLHFEAIPIGNIPFEFELTSIRMGDVLLHKGRSSPLIGFAKAAPDHTVLQLPIRNVETFILNGFICRRGVVGAQTCNAEILLANPQPSSHASLVLPFQAVEKLLEPPAKSKLLQPCTQVIFQADPNAWDRCEEVILAARQAATVFPEIFATEQPRLALRESLLQSVHGLVGPERETELRMPRSSRARRRIVVAADEYLRAHVDRPIYTEELCDVLAVSASSLAEAFRAVFMISPHRFLKLRRLSMVRAALRCPEAGVPLVKSVALAHGFWHLGQFAHDYREAFGETPSETLDRARGGIIGGSA